MSAIETVTFTKEVPIADADGKPIREGSVLREIKGGDVGVVTRIIRKGDTHGPLFSQIGDVAISTSPAVTRITNRYSQWRHVPHNEQTYKQRLQSWRLREYKHDDFSSVSESEGIAIEGIMALLPDDIVDWEYGPYPDTLDGALGILEEHLTELLEKAKK